MTLCQKDAVTKYFVHTETPVSTNKELNDNNSSGKEQGQLIKKLANFMMSFTSPDDFV